MSIFIDDLLAHANRSLALRKVILFGSRARGTERPNSDYDLAFVHDSSPEAWANFVNQMHEEAMTLLDIDLVDWAEASEPLRASIARDGRVLYER